MSQAVPEKIWWTTSDLELLSNAEWKRYEIIDGELFVTRANNTSDTKLLFAILLLFCKLGRDPLTIQQRPIIFDKSKCIVEKT